MLTRISILITVIGCICLQILATPLIVAHRGASHEAPENTIPAFELAWKQRADAIETDVHLTQDQEIVCIHDKTTKNVAREEKTVVHSTLQELQRLDVGIRFGRRWKGTSIPTLREVFTTIPAGKKIFIEIKCGAEILPKLFEEHAISDLTPEQIVVISFNIEVIAKVKRMAPTIKALLLSSFEIDRQSGTLIPSAQDMLHTLQSIHADGVSTEVHTLLDEAYVKQIIETGYEYHVWTIDSLKTARKFQEMGVMSITTNVPGRLKNKIR